MAKEILDEEHGNLERGLNNNNKNLYVLVSIIRCNVVIIYLRAS